VLADGPVNGLPFGALRLDEGGPPLSARFEITTVPSLAGWLALRREPHPPGDGVIALADPLLELNADRAPLRSAGALLSPVELGPLPHARREVRALSRWLAAPVQVLTGADATERAIKHGDLGRQAILHIAAHALVDDQHPERSAIVLAAGDEDEDGLLQLREIRELPLAGQLVVLSTCESASGPMMDGAGVQTLASAFIEAGARVVVASLWPLPDAAAADVMEAFVARLAHGKSVATALAEAQRDAVRHELPPVAWAGFVVVGDGGFVPFPGGAARRFSTRMAVVVAASGLGAAGIAAAWVLRRRAVSSSDAA
jgi:CHAT domain-containing protein